MIFETLHAGSHAVRAVMVIVGAVLGTVAGTRLNLGTGAGSTQIDITAIMVVAGLVGPTVYWLQGKLTRLEDSYKALAEQSRELAQQNRELRDSITKLTEHVHNLPCPHCSPNI